MVGILGIENNIRKAGETDGRVQNLASFITVETLREIHTAMDKNKAAGVDGVTKDVYAANLEQNLENLVKRLKNGSYRPQPSRRVLIPKADKGKFRPLGISSYEDKIVENAVAKILVHVYDRKFYDISYGFRPRRDCHMAIQRAVKDIQSHKTSYIVEADIRSFFDTVDHDWLIKMLEHDIADRKFIAIVKRFLEAGIMENGKYLDRERGTPQGNGASPVLANIYLHYVLDNWFDVMVTRKYKGETHLVRFADDFICCFQYKNEAERFLLELKQRFCKYGLQLADEKTKIIQFGRFAMQDRKDKGLGKPETFDFLGFTFYCSTDSRKRFFRCKVKTCRKKYIAKVKAMNEWVKTNRNLKLDVLFCLVNLKLQGHYNYYGVTDNSYAIRNFYYATLNILFKWLNRRSDKRSYDWNSFAKGLLRTFPLKQPRICYSLLSS